MKQIVVIAAMLTLFACSGPDSTHTPGFGAARERVFKECIEAAKVGQQSTHYADNAEVVDSCATQAYYIAITLAKSGDLKQERSK